MNLLRVSKDRFGVRFTKVAASLNGKGKEIVE